MQHRKTFGNALQSWRFPAFLILLLAAGAAAIPSVGWERGALAAFDAAATLFLLSCLSLLSNDIEDMRSAATANDAGRLLRLVMSVLLALVVFAAMAALTIDREELAGKDKLLIAATLVIVWLFANTMYALHYAHLYYSTDEEGRDCAGLDFPATEQPIMADFAYFAFTIGVALQTADVSISSRSIRRVVTVHEIVAFLFNIGVLALTVNVLGSA